VKGSLESSALLAPQREEEVRKAVQDQKARVIALKYQRDQIDMLTRELANAQSALDSTTQRANQIRLESQRNLTDIAVLDPAIPPSTHSKPKVKLNIAISILLGLLLGCGLGYLFEVADRRVRSDADITESLNLPVLAVIETLPKKPDLVGSLLGNLHHSRNA
jgi:succinoglycan biosynthesis transport protein ExoP